jgi:hypothetical protein
MALVNKIQYRFLDEDAVIPIPLAYIHCSVFIYKTVEHANEGASSGGSGFLVGIPLETNKEKTQVYVVTCRHVLEGMRNPVIRLNLFPGQTKPPMETNRLRWIDHPDHDDLSVYPLPIDFQEDAEYDLTWVALNEFVDFNRSTVVFPGDEVFMVGRFISHEGKQQNAPAVRFGNISMMAGQPMKSKFKDEQQTFLVEHRSLPGYSGSPVFVFLDPSQPRPPMWMVALNRAGKINIETTGPWLLGIDWVHIHNYEPVLTERDEKALAEPRRWVKAHTGMAGVIPAWRLHDVLTSPEMQMARNKQDERITQEKKNISYLSYDSAPEETGHSAGNSSRMGNGEGQRPGDR